MEVPERLLQSWPRKCAFIVGEILQTEETYVRSLREIVNGYLHPLCYNGLDDIDSVEGMFLNIKELYIMHYQLESQLNSSAGDPRKFAEVFIDYSDRFEEEYSVYCSKHPEMSLRLQGLMENVDTERLLGKCQRSLGHALPLSSQLLKPVQRVLRYKLLLEKLHSVAVKSNEAHDMLPTLQKALSVMERVADKINEKKRQHETMTKFKDIKDNLVGWNGQTGLQVEEFVCLDEIRVVGARNPRAVLVMDQVVLVLKPRDSKYFYKNHIYVDEMIVQDKGSAGEEDCLRLCRQNNLKDVFTLQFSSLEIKAVWLKMLTKLLLNSIKAAKSKPTGYRRSMESRKGARRIPSPFFRAKRRKQDKSLLAELESSPRKPRRCTAPDATVAAKYMSLPSRESSSPEPFRSRLRSWDAQERAVAQDIDLEDSFETSFETTMEMSQEEIYQNLPFHKFNKDPKSAQKGSAISLDEYEIIKNVPMPSSVPVTTTTIFTTTTSTVHTTTATTMSTTTTISTTSTVPSTTSSIKQSLLRTEGANIVNPESGNVKDAVSVSLRATTKYPLLSQRNMSYVEAQVGQESQFSTPDRLNEDSSEDGDDSDISLGNEDIGGSDTDEEQVVQIFFRSREEMISPVDRQVVTSGPLRRQRPLLKEQGSRFRKRSSNSQTGSLISFTSSDDSDDELPSKVPTVQPGIHGSTHQHSSSIDSSVGSFLTSTPDKTESSQFAHFHLDPSNRVSIGHSVPLLDDPVQFATASEHLQPAANVDDVAAMSPSIPQNALYLGLDAVRESNPSRPADQSKLLHLNRPLVSESINQCSAAVDSSTSEAKEQHVENERQLEATFQDNATSQGKFTDYSHNTTNTDKVTEMIPVRNTDEHTHDSKAFPSPSCVKQPQEGVEQSHTELHQSSSVLHQSSTPAGTQLQADTSTSSGSEVLSIGMCNNDSRSRESSATVNDEDLRSSHSDSDEGVAGGRLKRQGSVKKLIASFEGGKRKKKGSHQVPLSLKTRDSQQPTVIQPLVPVKPVQTMASSTSPLEPERAVATDRVKESPTKYGSATDLTIDKAALFPVVRQRSGSVGKLSEFFEQVSGTSTESKYKTLPLPLTSHLIASAVSIEQLVRPPTENENFASDQVFVYNDTCSTNRLSSKVEDSAINLPDQVVDYNLCIPGSVQSLAPISTACDSMSTSLSNTINTPSASSESHPNVAIQSSSELVITLPESCEGEFVLGSSLSGMATTDEPLVFTSSHPSIQPDESTNELCLTSTQFPELLPSEDTSPPNSTEVEHSPEEHFAALRSPVNSCTLVHQPQMFFAEAHALVPSVHSPVETHVSLPQEVISCTEGLHKSVPPEERDPSLDEAFESLPQEGRNPSPRDILEPLPLEGHNPSPQDILESLPQEEHNPSPQDILEPLPQEGHNPSPQDIIPLEGHNPSPQDILEPLPLEGHNPSPQDILESLPLEGHVLMNYDELEWPSIHQTTPTILNSQAQPDELHSLEEFALEPKMSGVMLDQSSQMFPMGVSEPQESLSSITTEANQDVKYSLNNRPAEVHPPGDVLEELGITQPPSLDSTVDLEWSERALLSSPIGWHTEFEEPEEASEMYIKVESFGTYGPQQLSAEAVNEEPANNPIPLEDPVLPLEDSDMVKIGVHTDSVNTIIAPNSLTDNMPGILQDECVKPRQAVDRVGNGNENQTASGTLLGAQSASDDESQCRTIQSPSPFEMTSSEIELLNSMQHSTESTSFSADADHKLASIVHHSDTMNSDLIIFSPSNEKTPSKQFGSPPEMPLLEPNDLTHSIPSPVTRDSPISRVVVGTPVKLNQCTDDFSVEGLPSFTSSILCNSQQHEVLLSSSPITSASRHLFLSSQHPGGNMVRNDQLASGCDTVGTELNGATPDRNDSGVQCQRYESDENISSSFPAGNPSILPHSVVSNGARPSPLQPEQTSPRVYSTVNEPPHPSPDVSTTEYVGTELAAHVPDSCPSPMHGLLLTAEPPLSQVPTLYSSTQEASVEMPAQLEPNQPSLQLSSSSSPCHNEYMQSSGSRPDSISASYSLESNVVKVTSPDTHPGIAANTSKLNDVKQTSSGPLLDLVDISSKATTSADLVQPSLLANERFDNADSHDAKHLTHFASPGYFHHRSDMILPGVNPPSVDNGSYSQYSRHYRGHSEPAVSNHYPYPNMPVNQDQSYTQNPYYANQQSTTAKYTQPPVDYHRLEVYGERVNSTDATVHGRKAQSEPPILGHSRSFDCVPLSTFTGYANSGAHSESFSHVPLQKQVVPNSSASMLVGSDHKTSLPSQFYYSRDTSHVTDPIPPSQWSSHYSVTPASTQSLQLSSKHIGVDARGHNAAITGASSYHSSHQPTPADAYRSERHMYGPHTSPVHLSTSPLGSFTPPVPRRSRVSTPPRHAPYTRAEPAAVAGPGTRREDRTGHDHVQGDQPWQQPFMYQQQQHQRKEQVQDHSQQHEGLQQQVQSRQLVQEQQQQAKRYQRHRQAHQEQAQAYHKQQQLDKQIQLQQVTSQYCQSDYQKQQQLTSLPDNYMKERSDSTSQKQHEQTQRNVIPVNEADYDHQASIVLGPTVVNLQDNAQKIVKHSGNNKEFTTEINRKSFASAPEPSSSSTSTSVSSGNFATSESFTTTLKLDMHHCNSNSLRKTVSAEEASNQSGTCTPVPERGRCTARGAVAIAMETPVSKSSRDSSDLWYSHLFSEPPTSAVCRIVDPSHQDSGISTRINPKRSDDASSLGKEPCTVIDNITASSSDLPSVPAVSILRTEGLTPRRTNLSQNESQPLRTNNAKPLNILPPGVISQADKLGSSPDECSTNVDLNISDIEKGSSRAHHVHVVSAFWRMPRILLVMCIIVAMLYFGLSFLSNASEEIRPL